MVGDVGVSAEGVCGCFEGFVHGGDVGSFSLGFRGVLCPLG